MSRRATRTWVPALLVLAITAAIWFGGGASEGSNDATPTEPAAVIGAAVTPTETGTSVLPTATAILPVEPTTVPSPTSPPTPEPSPTPSPTPEPVSTERPVPPPTGVDGESLIVARGDSGRVEVALTFDAGEGAGYTNEILDLLAEHGITASFGVTGQWAEQNPELIRRIVDEGHMLINHTYDHRSWTGVSPGTEPLSAEERMAQVTQTEQIVWDIAGYEMQPYFRFPYGDYDPESLVLLKQAGYDYSLWWTCDTLAWNGGSPQEIVQRCSPDDPERGGPGAVILMHVAQEGDWNALPAIIDAYSAAGYDFVTMEQLVQP